jgi:hypothetical protein
MRLDLRTEARRLLPAVPSIPHLAASARATWHGRMVNEFSSGRVFDQLADQLETRGVGERYVTQCRGFAGEERNHGALCGAVVEALGGQAVGALRVEGDLPEHPDAGALAGVARNVLSVSCLSETVAVSLIGAERLEMPEGPLRELLTRIWADEIGHARFGWKLVASLLGAMNAAERKQVGAYLPVALSHLEGHELAHLPLGAQPPPEGAALGLCSGTDARRLFYATVLEVIVPGLDAMGLDATGAWRRRCGKNRSDAAEPLADASHDQTPQATWAGRDWLQTV